MLISTFNSVYDLFQNFFNLIQLSKKVGDLMIEFYSQKTGIKIDENLSAEKFGKNLKCETLIIHDEDDKEIPFEDSQLIAKSIKNVKLSTILATSAMQCGNKKSINLVPKALQQ